ncbi:site-specific DNA-methyltransferase [Acidobacteriota bacterium]
MSEINLTEEEKMQIIEAINQNTEPSSDLMTKLFPRLADKFDVAKLNRAKIATLEYAGKRTEAAILNQTLSIDGGSPLQLERCFVEGSISDQTQLDLFEQSQRDDSEWRNLIVQGDNLQFLKTCYQNTDPLIRDKVKGKVKLFYIDPPFATKSEFSGALEAKSYSDKVDTSEFIEGIRERLIYMREMLAVDGSIYVHLDCKMVHYIKIVIDEIFGRERFESEIIFKRTAGHHLSKSLDIMTDFILWYSNSTNFIYKQQVQKLSDKEIEEKFPYVEKDTGRRFTHRSIEETNNAANKNEVRIIHGKEYRTKMGWRWTQDTVNRRLQDNPHLILFTSKGKPRYKIYADEYEGRKVGNLWDDIRLISSNSSESVGYPTQKPEDLLERIIGASSEPGDLIVDLFAGSGTVAAVAEKLGRRWIVCDFGKHAIYTMQRRLLRISESRALGKDVKKGQKYERPPIPFCVISCGAYDFSRIMNLRENKDAYINFVLGLFQLSRDQKNLNVKYKLMNIYGEKDGDPVEVYPVWEDAYLKEVRIDGNYLKDIIIQSGGKLKGNYYIITPETCTVVSETTMKNNAGDNIYFKLLKFPYKILEDVSRNFQIHDQPSSQENVNELINSTGFYFNNDVEIELEKTNDGLKLTKFKTRILDQKGNHYEGTEGLAMLLIDIDYNGELFDMEQAVFAKELDENGAVKIAGLSDCVAVIAIDKHGNESKPFIMKD